MINLTENAIGKIQEILAEENDPTIKLRVFVQGGGCSGFSYGFTLDHDQNDDDFSIKSDDLEVLVDAMSMQYLSGARIDYKEELMGSSFVIDNPQAVSTCGCGSSFSI
jgi:iron-sulfur cluster insertion protein